MYTLFSSLSSRRFITEQATTLGASLIIAEFLYKFHSFILEAVAFLLTWFLLDALVQFLRRN